MKITMINILEIHVEVPHQKFQRGATEMTLEGNFQIVITLNLSFNVDVQAGCWNQKERAG